MKKMKKANCHLPKYDFSGLVGMSGNMLPGIGQADQIAGLAASKNRDSGSVADNWLNRDPYGKIKAGFKKALPFAGLAGSAIYTAANPSDDYSDEKGSALGMGLQGAAMGSKFGGIYGAIGGGLLGAGIGWYGAKKRNIEREEADNNLYNAYILNSTVDPTKMQEGGPIHIKEENKGKFTKYAKSKGMSVQEAAHWVMANSKDPDLRKRAQFAINATKFNHPHKMEEGGGIDPQHTRQYSLNKSDPKEGLGLYYANFPKTDTNYFEEAFSLPQKSLMKLLTGEYDSPSNILYSHGALDPKNNFDKAIGFFYDQAIDPTNFIGGIYTKAGKYAKESLVLDKLKTNLWRVIKAGDDFFDAKENIEKKKHGGFIGQKMKKGIKVGNKGSDFEETGSYMSMPVMDKNNVIIPQMYGSVGDKGIPITHIQTEDGEKIIYPDGSIFDTKAKVTHEKMSKDEVTDILPQGSYIFGARDKQAIKKKTAEKISMGNTPIVYNEFDNSPQTNAEEIKLSDLFKKEEHTPAELADIVKKKFKLSGKSSDAFTDVTNEENKVGRIPYLMNIMKLTEDKKGNKMAEDVPNEMKKGGMVKTKKYDIGGLVGLMSQYLPPYKVNLPDGQTSLPTDAPPDNSIDSIYSKYGQDMKNFSDKYQQKYADYFKYARGANAAANAMGVLGTVGQSSYVNPGLLSNRYANQMFQKVPNFVRDANKTESLAPIYAIGRNQGVLGIPTSTTMSRLAPMVGNAVNSVNQTNKQFALDDVSKDNARYKFMQDIDNKNLTNIANAQNRSIGMDNYKMSQVAGFGGRALTGDATLAGKELGTNMGLEKQAIDAGFNSAAQMAAYKIQQQMMDKLYGKNGSANIKVDPYKKPFNGIPKNSSDSNGYGLIPNSFGSVSIPTNTTPTMNIYKAGDMGSYPVTVPDNGQWSDHYDFSPSYIQERQDMYNKGGENYNSDSIKGVQKELKDMGYEVGNIDGIYGKKTKAALKSFIDSFK